MADLEKIEYDFQVRGVDVEIQRIEAEIARLSFEKDQLNYQKIVLSINYNEYKKTVESHQVETEVTHNKELNVKLESTFVETKFGETEFEPVDEIEELKPRKLKK